MGLIINAIKTQLPHASIILRPYMADVENPHIKELCEQLSPYTWITIDDTKGRSDEFYQRCDMLITDASSGGVSFMLSTCRLPIYYVASDSEAHPMVDAWLGQVGNFLPIARNTDELQDLLLGFDLLTAEQRYEIYKAFYESEFGGFHPPEEVFLDLVRKQHDSEFCYFSMDGAGNVTSA